jgi:PAS domain S-box-containing protein
VLNEIPPKGRTEMAKKQLSALLLEDCEDDALLIVRELERQGFDVKWERAWTAPAMKSLLDAESWDVVLSDYSMPGFDAPAALQLLQGSGQDIPFIVVSGTIGEEAAVALMKNGAHDYIMKGRLARLGAAIEREIRDAGIRREHQNAVVKVQHLNRVLRAIRNVNQLIAREKDPLRLIEGGCECLVETRGYDAAWIVLLNERHETTAVRGRGYKNAWGDIRTSLERGALPLCAVEALASSKVVFVDEQATACQDCAVHQHLGFHKTLTVRIEHQERVYGLMAVTLLGGVPIDEFETSLFEEVAGDLGFALWGIETEAERLRSEGALREEQALLLTIARNFPNSYLSIVDEELRVVFSSGQEFAKRGLDPRDYEGMTVEQVFGEQAGVVTEHYLQTFQGQETTFELVVDDQTQLYKTVPLRDEQGEVHRILAVVENITERKRAEDALRLEKDFNETLIRTAQTIVLVLDTEGRIVLFNPYLEALSGHTLEEMRGEDWCSTFLPQRNRAGTRELFRQAIDDDATRGNVDVLLTRDGRELLIEWYDKVLKDGQGQTTGLLCIGQDVTAREQAEGRLKESEAYLTNIINAIGDPVFVKDEDLRFTLINEAVCTLLGKAQHELIGTTGAEFLLAEELDHFLSVDREVLSSGVENICEEPLTANDGTVRTVVTKKTLYVDSRGAKHIVGVIRDMSEIKQMQAQIAQSDRLATMGMLAAGVAHEINNPLAYVLYNLESLSDDLSQLSSSLRKGLGIIVERVGHEEWASLMGKDQELLNPSMLDDIRDRFKDALQGTHRIRDVARGLGMFSRVEREQMVPVVLMHVIEVAISMASNEIKYRARLVKEYGATSTILASDGRLSQVFLNLLINAAHAIQEGDVERNEIRVRTWQEGDEVFAEVRDTGKGIAREHLGRLFEPFFTTKEIGVGTGLGLPISKKIIEEYGGRIEVESEIGAGTRFVVCLPVDRAEERAEAAQIDQVLAQPEARGRILVVDDEARIRGAMVRMLRGHDVVQAASGEEARKVLKADQAFDLILCDMMMPGLSGVDLHEWLATAYPNLAQQVVFITGGAFTPRAREHLTRVSNIRLKKPFDVANFKKIVAELIVAHRARGS